MVFFFYKVRKLCRCVLIFSGICFWVFDSAAEDALPSEQDFLQELPIVLSASRLLQPQSEAPNAVTVLDRDMIRASGFRNIGDLFRLVPGMFVGNLNNYSPVVSYHGSTEEFSRRMQVLVDGRSVYLPPLSTVDWEDIPLHIEDIERIEVVRGPAAASHGANSMQGVINIITRDASGFGGFSGSVTSGSFGVADSSVRFGRAGEKFDYRVTLSHREDEGYGSKVMNDYKRTNQANLRAAVHTGGGGSVDLQLGYSDSRRGLGIAGKTYDIFREASIASHFQQATWLSLLETGEFRVQYYHINRSSVDPALYSLNAGGQTRARTEADRHDIEVQHTIQLGKNNRMVWGAGMRSDYAESKESLVVPYTVRENRIFAHDEWRFMQSALLNIGTMLESDGLGNVTNSPRAAVNYHLSPQHSLRASTSVAYRTPAIYEEHASITGNSTGQIGTYVSKGGLRPEKGVSREVGYLGEFPSADMSLELRGYDDLISDVVFVDPQATYYATTSDYWPYSFANLYSINYTGYESTVKYHWSESGNIVISASRQFARCTITGTPTQSALLSTLQGYMNDCPLAVPDYSGSILVNQRVMGSIEFSASYYHSGSLKMIAATPQTVMNRVDLRVSYRFGKVQQSGSGEVSLVVQNAFSDPYTKYSTESETNNMSYQRRAYLGASYYF